MKQIILYVYQSIDGCPVFADKEFDVAVNDAGCILTDEETYLRIYSSHSAWPVTTKETYVVTAADGCMDLTGSGHVQFVSGDIVTKLRQMKEDGVGTVVAYGEEIGALLLDNRLADEIVVTTVPRLAGGGEKALECGLNDGGAWVARSNKVLEDGKIRTVYGRA